MSLRFYMDVHVPWPITLGLRMRGVDVLTAQEDQAATREDAELLQRATLLGRLLFTHDSDFFRIAAEFARSGVTFCGVVYAHPLAVPLGRCVMDLELIAKAGDAATFANRVEHLPY